MSYQGSDLVEVRAWGKRVGAVAQDKESGFYAFEYSQRWLSTQIELSPLAMPNTEEIYSFRNLDPITFYKLPPMLADALPDRFGNALINAFLAGAGIRAEQITQLDRLAYMGTRGMGALTFHPPLAEGEQSGTAISLADLVAAAKSTLAGEINEDLTINDALAQLIQVGTSAGGARAKAVIAYNPETKQYRSGQVAAPPGFQQSILKLDGVTNDPKMGLGGIGEEAEYCRIEYAYYLMARAAGIEISDSELLLEGPRAHFLTKRFDRDENENRIHMQSLCAMSQLDFNLAGTHSYAQYFQTIRALGMGEKELAQGFRRMVFNVAACNRDDHTKNLSFLLPENGGWKLAPAYDVTYAHSLKIGWTVNHQMSVNNKFDGITKEDLRIVGDRQFVPGVDAIISDVLQALEQWPEFAKAAGLSSAREKRISLDMKANRPT